MKYNEEKTLERFVKLNTDTWEGIKDNVMVHLINSKYLSQYGKDVCYNKVLDLAMVFAIQEKDKDGLRIYYLSNEDTKKYGVTIETLREVAMKNAEHSRKKRLVTLSDSIAMTNMLYPLAVKMPGTSMGVGGQGGPTIGVLQDVSEDQENILVVTNKGVPFGAQYMLLPSVLEEVYARFNNENFYILPMSRHQAWYIRRGYVTHDETKPWQYVEDDLLDMIEEFNDTQNKSWKDILSYKLYYYIGDDGKLIVPIS